ncbi:MAG: hypothetical protein ACRD0Y_13415, partial [Terriglobales bacterium]
MTMPAMAVMSSPWLPVLASALMQFVWEAAAVALVVVAAQPVLRRRSSGARYAAHAAALFALPALFAATVVHYAGSGTSLAGASASLPLLQPIAPYIVMAWAAGIVVCGSYAALGWSWAQWLRHSAQCSALAGVPAAWRSDMQRLARAMNLRARAGLQVSARVSGPCTLGWW